MSSQYTGTCSSNWRTRSHRKRRFTSINLDEQKKYVNDYFEINLLFTESFDILGHSYTVRLSKQGYFIWRNFETKQ